MSVWSSKVFYGVNVAVDEKFGSERYACHGYGTSCYRHGSAGCCVSCCSAADRTVTVSSQLEVSKVSSLTGVRRRTAVAGRCIAAVRRTVRACILAGIITGSILCFICILAVIIDSSCIIILRIIIGAVRRTILCVGIITLIIGLVLRVILVTGCILAVIRRILLIWQLLLPLPRLLPEPLLPQLHAPAQPAPSGLRYHCLRC